MHSWTHLFRRDQRAFMLHFTGLMVGPVPVTTMPVSFRKKRARHEQHPHNTKCLACFRLRHGDGRFAPAPFLPSLRLRFTFPFAEPQAEATRGKRVAKFFTCAYLNNNFGGLKYDRDLSC